MLSENWWEKQSPSLQSKPLPNRVSCQEQQHHPIRRSHPDQPLIDPSSLPHLLLEEAGEKITVERVEDTLTVEEIGTILVEETDDGDIAQPLHRSIDAWR